MFLPYHIFILHLNVTHLYINECIIYTMHLMLQQYGPREIIQILSLLCIFEFTLIVNYYYRCYDSLQYPLLFPYSENGWHRGIEKIKPLTTHSATKHTVK